MQRDTDQRWSGQIRAAMQTPPAYYPAEIVVRVRGVLSKYYCRRRCPTGSSPLSARCWALVLPSDLPFSSSMIPLIFVQSIVAMSTAYYMVQAHRPVPCDYISFKIGIRAIVVCTPLPACSVLIGFLLATHLSTLTYFLGLRFAMPWTYDNAYFILSNLA